MNVLCMDSSTSSGSIAIINDERLLFLGYTDSNTTHSERLMPTIDQGIKQCNMKISDFDVILISIGPGSFTGLRIGLATAKGISYAYKIPIVPISSLKMYAYNLGKRNKDILVFLDGRMKEVYTALYDSNFKTIIREMNCKPEKMISCLNNEFIVVGNGYDLYKTEFHNLKINYEVASWSQNIPLASILFNIFKNEIQEFGYDHNMISTLEPNYLRKSQAEIIKENS